MKKAMPKATQSAMGEDPSPSEQIDARIEELGDWRGAVLARVRKIIKQADPAWSRHGSGA